MNIRILIPGFNELALDKQYGIDQLNTVDNKVNMTFYDTFFVRILNVTKNVTTYI